MLYGYIVANDSCNGLPSNVNSFRSMSSSSTRLSRLPYVCCLPDMVTLFVLPIAQIKTSIKAVRRLYLAIQCTCLSQCHSRSFRSVRIMLVHNYVPP